ncbi:MAG: sce7726 family protein, partial [Flavobacteriaceae bacterium]|nr:sce7726 family protein [Flavobacteriaceae bacterium]
KLLKEDDYSFLNSRLIEYDNSLLSGKLTTYSDYLKFIYKELRKNYRNEYIYKNTLINELLLKKYGVKDTIVINEFRVGNSIADTVMFNGTSKAFEIKTELDSEKRLPDQLADYTKIFKECYVVTHEKLVGKYTKANKNIGIIALSNGKRSLKIEEVKSAKISDIIDVSILMKTVRTSEYKYIVEKHYGQLPEMNDFNMFDICEELIMKIPNNKLNELFLEVICKRKSNTGKLRTFSNELRQLALAMNFNSDTYNLLLEKLNKPITI